MLFMRTFHLYISELLMPFIWLVCDGCRASKEEHSQKNHMIVEDGYNLGRDWLVERAEAGSHFKGIWWRADIEWREGLLEPGHEGS